MIVRRLAGVLAATALLVLPACSGSGSEDESASTATPSGTPTATAAPTVDPDEAACGYLTAAERRKLTGEAIDEVVATSGAAGSSRCRWQSAQALIEVTTLPAEAWARSLPQVVAQLESSADVSTSADKAVLARAKKLLAKADSFTGAEACAAFTTLAELGGGSKGASSTVTYVPITETETGVSAQGCSRGELTSVIYSSAGLKKSDAIDAAAQKALTEVQRRVSAG